MVMFSNIWVALPRFLFCCETEREDEKLQKQELLRRYMNTLDLANKLIREYAEIVTCGSPADVLTAMGVNVTSRRAECQNARQRYSDHRRAHGC